MIRVFIADDHSIVRRGLRELLSAAPDIDVVGEASDGSEVLRRYEPALWDILILDLSLPRISGVEVVSRLHAMDRGLKILVFSMYPEEQYAPRLLQLGATAYLSKEHPSEEVLTAVRALATKGRYESPRVAAGLLDAPEKKPHETLTGREFQVLVLLCQSRTSIEIAAELNVSASTVSNHVAHIKTKLGVRTSSDIVSYAIRCGLVD